MHQLACWLAYIGRSIAFGVEGSGRFGVHRGHDTVKMGICMSANAEDVEQKKRSQAIDEGLAADARRLRRECKILLLGEFHGI